MPRRLTNKQTIESVERLMTWTIQVQQQHVDRLHEQLEKAIEALLFFRQKHAAFRKEHGLDE